METRNDPATRKYWKLRVVKGLFHRGWSKEMVLQLFSVIDYFMELPESVAREFEVEWAELDEEKTMQYVTSVERHGIEKGRVEGLIEGIAALLEAKFGKAGLKLLPTVRSLNGLPEVRKFVRFLKKADNLDEVRQYLA